MNYQKVWVVCTDGSHEGRTAKVTCFQFQPDTPWPWVQLPAVREDTGEYRPMDPEVFQNSRHQNLICKLCGLKVSARMDTLTPIMERLTEADVTSVELAHLARIVANARSEP